MIFAQLEFKGLQKSSLPNFGNTDIIQKEVSKTSHIPKRCPTNFSENYCKKNDEGLKKEMKF
jgi:hypothetical protein